MAPLLNIGEDEKVRIVNDLFRQGVYVRAPVVDISERGEISWNGNLEREIALWFDENDFDKSQNQERAIELYLRNGLSFSFSNESGGGYAKAPPSAKSAYETIEQARELVKENDKDHIGDEHVARAILGAFDLSNRWLLMNRYKINPKMNPAEFEQMHVEVIGTTINLTTDTFRRYLEYLKGVHRDINNYFGERVRYDEMNRFVVDNHDLWFGSWNIFFGGDEYLDDNLKPAPLELSDCQAMAEGYTHWVPVSKPHEVAPSFTSIGSVFRDELERVHREEPLQFLVESEVSRLNKSEHKIF